MIEVAMRNILTADTSVAGLVADRVYFVNRPQDERRPCVVLNLVSATPARVYQGQSGPGIDTLGENNLAGLSMAQLNELSDETIAADSRGGYINGRMQVVCLAPTYPVTKQLAAAARAALEAFSGLNDGTIVSYIEADSYRDIPALPLQGAGAAATYGVSIDAIFMHKEEE